MDVVAIAIGDAHLHHRDVWNLNQPIGRLGRVHLGEKVAKPRCGQREMLKRRVGDSLDGIGRN